MSSEPEDWTDPDAVDVSFYEMNLRMDISYAIGQLQGAASVGSDEKTNEFMLTLAEYLDNILKKYLGTEEK